MRFGTHMLAEEADDWWIGLLPILEQDGAEVTWAVFKREFLDRYIPEDVRGKKEIEFVVLYENLYVHSTLREPFDFILFLRYKLLPFKNGMNGE